VKNEGMDKALERNPEEFVSIYAFNSAKHDLPPEEFAARGR